MSKEQFKSSVKELEARTDNSFPKYYVETSSLKSLARFGDSGYVAVGLKGIGKSGAYRYLTEIDKKADLSVGISVATDSLNLPKVKYNCLRIATVFKRNLSTYILDGLLKQESVSSKIAQDLLQETRVEIGDLWGKVKNIAKGFAGLSILGFGFSIKTVNRQEKVEIESTPTSMRAEELVKEICRRGLKIRLVIDDPDRLLSTEGEPNAQLIAGLCLAAYELSKNAKNLKVIILTKSHIFGRIMEIDEMNNLPTDFAVKLFWQEDELKDVIRRRMHFANIKLSDIVVKSAYNEEEFFAMLFRISRNGPRDCLRRIELCLGASERQMVGKEEIASTIHQYADRCKEQMRVTYQDQYPGIFELVEGVFEGKPDLVLSRRTFQKRHEELVLNNRALQTLFKEKWARQATEAMRALFESGCIAFVDNGGLILPYQERYYDYDALAHRSFTTVPAFAPLISGDG